MIFHECARHDSLSQLHGHRYHRPRSSRPYDRFLPWNIRRWWNRCFWDLLDGGGWILAEETKMRPVEFLRHFWIMTWITESVGHVMTMCVWAFTTMCKLPRIPPWNRCFSLKMYQEENISRKWCTFSCHSVMSFLGLQVCILPHWILLCAPFTNTKTGAFGMLISS